MTRPKNRHAVPAVARAGRLAATSVVLLAVTSAAPALAAKVYRCGNSYQDQPCQEVKVVAAALPVDRNVVVIRDNTCASNANDGTGRPACATKSTRDLASAEKR